MGHEKHKYDLNVVHFNKNKKQTPFIIIAAAHFTTINLIADNYIFWLCQLTIIYYKRTSFDNYYAQIVLTDHI